MSRKPLLLFVFLLCLTGGSLAAYGLIFAESAVVHVDMQYSVVLSNSVADSAVTLNAAVTNNGNPVRAGINVDFYYSLNGGAWTYIDSQLTDAVGVAHATYLVMVNGGYDFKAIVTVPAA
jgi:hypothetical protein